jgi:NAD(P)-dependent dehydrogenase (short-subunit alcohol dehydrogenase family)
MSLRAIVLGAGKNVGQSVIRKLKDNGYNVAAVSRNPDLGAAKEDGYHAIKFDLADSQQLSEAFAEAEKKLGGFPGVIVYNGFKTHPPLFYRLCAR